MICLMPNCAFLSETSRMIQIRRALQNRGADARIATHGGLYERVLINEGIDYDIVGPPMDEARSRRLLLDTVGIGDPGQSMYGRDEMRAYVLAEAEYFRQNGVRAVVIGFTLTTLLSTRIAGIPLVATHAGSYVPLLLESERQAVPPPSRRPYLSGFDAAAAELGIPRIPSFPALLLGDLSLVTEVPELYGLGEEEFRAWRPSDEGYWPTTRLEVTGPIYAELDLPIPPLVEEALRRKGPTVYVAVTSAPVELVRAVVLEVAGTDAEVIVASTVHDLADLAGPRITVGGLLPSHRIMPRVDLVVIAGGQGSLQCAAASGTPVVGIPLQPEQEANLRWLERTGLARPVARGEVGRGVLPALVQEMTADARYKAAATKLRSAYARRNGPVLSADAILRFVADQSR